MQARAFHAAAKTDQRCEDAGQSPMSWLSHGHRNEALRLVVPQDEAPRQPSWGRTRSVTVDSGQKQSTEYWVSMGEGFTKLSLGTLCGGAGQMSIGKSQSEEARVNVG